MISAISVKDRLKKRADQNGKTMQEMLIVYGLERTIFRISVSEYADRFTLKGGILLYALFNGDYSRVTRDIDFSAQNTSNRVEDMTNVFGSIFRIRCDGALKCPYFHRHRLWGCCISGQNKNGVSFPTGYEHS